MQPTAANDRPFEAAAPQALLRRDGTDTLEQLKAATMACRACPIGECATQSVIGEGNPHAALMLVGEQPGDQEDLQGPPFVGPAGKLLARALASAGIARGQAFVSNGGKALRVRAARQAAHPQASDAFVDDLAQRVLRS